MVAHSDRGGRPGGWILVAVAVAALAAGFVARRALAPETASSSVTPPVVVLEFDLAALDGPPVSSRQYTGRAVVVDFWATWCGPCRIQADILHALEEEYRSEPVSFLAVNVGEPEDLVRQFVAEDPFEYPVLMDPDQDLSARYGIIALPTLMVLDGEQRVVFSNTGVASATQVAAAIRRALAAAG
jgi:thiol-disulfide isomerase/thioredoxin